MNSNKIKLLTLSVLTLTLALTGFASKAHAKDIPLNVIRDVSDDDTDAMKLQQCGKSEDTSLACQSALTNCQAGFDKIIDNAYQVCNQLHDGCEVGVTDSAFPSSDYDVLIEVPLKLYSNSVEVAVLNNCRQQHPKSGDVVQASNVTIEQKVEEERKREIELGEIDPKANNANTAPAAPAAPAEVQAAPVAAQVAPAVVSNEGIAPANVDANSQNDASGSGGCSIQNAPSSRNFAQGCFAAILMVVPFVAVVPRRARALKK